MPYVCLSLIACCYWFLCSADEIKLALAGVEIFDILLHLADKQNFSAEDKTTIENVTSDLIVLILTGGKKNIFGGYKINLKVAAI